MMRNELYWVGVFLLILWLVFIVDVMIPYHLTDWGLQPRTASGIPGVLLMPFLHGNVGHIFSNTVSLAILLTLLSGSRSKPWLCVGLIILLSGVLLWLIGRNQIHVGASGVAFGVIGLLIVSGFLEKRPVAIGVAVLVGLLFGGTVLSGLIPDFGGNVSWDGHFCGLVAGVATACLSAKNPSLFSNRDF